MKRQTRWKITIFVIMLTALLAGMMMTASAADSDEYESYYLKYDGTNTIYAEGIAITVKGENGKQYIYSDESGKKIAAKYTASNGTDTVITDVPKDFIIYGGSNTKSVEETSVTLDGVTLYAVYGGGKTSQGTVKGTSRLYMVNSVASKAINGGGRNSTCGNVDITVFGKNNSDKVSAGIYMAGYESSVTGNVKAYIANLKATGNYGGSAESGSVGGDIDVVLYNTTGTAFFAGGSRGNVSGKVTVHMRDCTYDYMSIGPKWSGTVKEAEVDVYKCSTVIYCGLYDAAGTGGVEKVTLRTGHTLNIYVSNGTVGELNAYCVKEESRDKIYVPDGCKTKINFHVFKSNTCNFSGDGVPTEVLVSKDTDVRQNDLTTSTGIVGGKTIDVKWLYLCKYVNGVKVEQYMPMSATWDRMITVASTDSHTIKINRSDKRIIDINDNVFTNGIPIVIREGKNGQYTGTYIYDASGMFRMTIVDENGKPEDRSLGAWTAVYGGSNDPNDVLIDTSVTMLGGYVKAIFGGGSGTITGTASVTLKGGRVDIIQGGGFGIGKVTNKAVVTIDEVSEDYVPEDDYDWEIKRINGGGYSGITNSAEIHYNSGRCMVIFGGGYLNTATTGETSIYLNGGKVYGMYAGGFAGECETGTAHIEISKNMMIETNISGGATLNLGNSGYTGAVINGGTIKMPKGMFGLEIRYEDRNKYTVTEV